MSDQRLESGGKLPKPMSNGAKKTMAPEIQAVLAQAVGQAMAEKIIVGSCNILTIDQDELFNDNFDMFVTRMETVIPAIIGIKPGEKVVKRLWGLKHGTMA